MFLIAMALMAAGAEPPTTPAAEDLARIKEVAASPATLDRLAGTSFPTSGPDTDKQSVDAATVIPVYSPDATFITGTSPTVGHLSYVAVPANTADGAPATIWLHKTAGDWKVYNVASGSVEKTMAAKAGKGYLLHEPQTNTWYAVNGDNLTNLTDGTTMSTTTYQSHLNTRYADKQPGSRYDKEGAAGGYPDDTGGVPWWPVVVTPLGEAGDAATR